MEPEVRYCTTSDGVRIAYTMTGSGPPLVHIPEPLASHAQLNWSHPVIGRIFREAARHNTYITFDHRGSGLSDRTLANKFEELQLDIEAVVGRVGLREFCLEASQLGTPAAVAYAADHPEQVTRVVLSDGFARWAELLATTQVLAFLAAVKLDWVLATEALGSAVFGVGREESRVHGEFLRAAADPETYLNTEIASGVDVGELAACVRAPTLVLKHAGIQFVTTEMSKDLAARIPDAQFAVVDGTWADNPEGYSRRVAHFVNGTEVASTARTGASSAQYQVVTVLFTDLVGHTEMMSRLGDERGRAVLREHESITREVLKLHGGTEVKTMGDGFMASFSSVTRAVECAIALQKSFAEREGEPLAVRVGLNAGEPIEEGGDLFGATVILASRIAAKAGAGEILVSDNVRSLSAGKGFLCSDRGEFVAKGFEEPVRISEVNWRS